MSKGKDNGGDRNRQAEGGLDGGSSPPASIEGEVVRCGEDVQAVIARLLFEHGMVCWCVVGFDDCGDLVRCYHADNDMHAKALDKAYEEWGESLEVEFEAEGEEWKGREDDE